MRRSRTFGILITLAIILSIVAVLLLPRPVLGVWKNYSLLLIPTGGGGEALTLAVLRDLGLGGFSESTEPVVVSSFSPQGNRGGLERLSLEEARVRLGERDPRRDTYIEGLPAWFRASQGSQGYRIIYLRGRLGSKARSGLATALKAKGIDAFFPEAAVQGRTDRSMSILLALAFAGLLASTRASRKALLLGGILLPLLPLALGGRDPALAGLLLGTLQASLLPTWELFIVNCLSRNGRRGAFRVFRGAEIQGLAFALPALGFAILNPGLLASCCLALLASSLAGAAALSLGRTEAGGHEAFVPLPILGRPKLSHAPSRLVKLSACLVVLALGGGILVRIVDLPEPAPGGKPSTLLLPQPILEGGGGLPGPSKAVSLLATRGELPNLADWLAHRWRQESLFFSVLGRDHPPFSTIDLPLAGEDSRLKLSPDAAWAREAYRDIPKNSVEDLLSSSARFTRVRVLPLSLRASGGPGPLAPIEVILYIILIAPPMLGALSPRMGGFRSRREHKQHHEAP